MIAESFVVDWAAQVRQGGDPMAERHAPRCSAPKLAFMHRAAYEKAMPGERMSQASLANAEWQVLD